MSLVQQLGGQSLSEATRYIVKHGRQTQQHTLEIVRQRLQKQTIDIWPQETIDQMVSALWNGGPVDYLRSRGLSDETIRHFELGYSPKQNLVVTPMHTIEGYPVGVIGRSVEQKVFKNSPGLPVKESLWNIHRARGKSDYVVICESNFDAMLIHQAGFPAVVATLGGTITPEKLAQVDRNFNGVVIFTDADEAGRKLGANIVAGLRHKPTFWAAYDRDQRLVFPPGAKDAGDLTDDQIKTMIQNMDNNFNYMLWNS